MKRRSFLQTFLTATGTATLTRLACGQEQPSSWEPRFILSSCMYGYQDLAVILPEAAKIGATAVDIWPKVHGSQREQIDEIGEAAFAEMLHRHQLTLGCLTHYGLGPFGLGAEMQLAKRLGCGTIVTGAKGPANLKGAELKSAVAVFVEKMRPHLDAAAQADVTIAIENHGNSLIQSPDSIRWLIELCPSPNLGIALAPYHLSQDPQRIARIIRDCDQRLTMFYAWQHGVGCMEKLPKAQELMQMPGRGGLDFAPIVQALQQMDYRGWVSIFMHPVPRGIPILPTTAGVTEEINRARGYLVKLIQ